MNPNFSYLNKLKNEIVIASIILNNILIFLGILLVVFLVLDVWILNFSGIKDWFFYVFKKEVLLDEEQKKEVKEYLNEIQYYTLLSEEAKDEFMKRTLYIIRKIEFTGTDYFSVTLRNQVLIAGSIIKITFGLKYYLITSIYHIKIFKKEIMNPRTKQQFYGLMFTSGKMYLSWEKLEHGIKVTNDGLNLVLHEATHGLFVLLKNSKLNFDEFENLLAKWQKLAESNIAKDRNDKAFFRLYARTNREEFFSILIENFFERPEEFKNLMPELYNSICVFLNQNPLNIRSDYKLNSQQEFMAESNVYNSTGVKQLNLLQDRWHWMYTLIILLGFFSFIANLILKNFLASGFGAIFATYLLSFPFIYILLKKYFVTSGRMDLKNYRTLSFFSISPIAVCLILTLNFLIGSSTIVSKKYAIERLNLTKGISINDGDLSYLEHNTLFCELESNDSYSISARECESGTSPFDTIVIQYHYGLTGLKVFDGNNIIKGVKNK